MFVPSDEVRRAQAAEVIGLKDIPPPKRSVFHLDQEAGSSRIERRNGTVD